MEALISDFDRIFALEVVMLCLIMMVGSYAIYTDIRFLEIPNLSVLFLLLAGLVSQMVFWVWGETTLWQVGLVTSAGLGLGYLLFLYGFWAAGDAKLFWVVLVALPPTICPLSFSSFFSFNASIWALLSNAMVLNFVATLLFLLKQKQLFRQKKRHTLRLKSVLWSGLHIAGLSGYIIWIGMFFLNRPMILSEATICTLVCYALTERFIQQQSERLFLIIPGLLLGLYASLTLQTGALLGAAWGISWGIQTVYLFFRSHFSRALVQTIAFDTLQVGMVPTVGIGMHSSGGEEICRAGQPLDVAGLRRLRTHAKQGGLAGKEQGLQVEMPMPFAPFIVLGAGMTLLMRGSLLRLLEVFLSI